MTRFLIFSLVGSIALALVLVASLLAAQQGTFVQPASRSELTPRQNDMLSAIQEIPSTEDVQVIHVNPNVLKNSDHVSIPLRARSISIENVSREFRGSNIVSWIGKAPNEIDGSTAMSVNGNNVTASIQTAEGLYRIRPLGDGLHALIKVNTGRFPPEHPKP